ncbi:MAG TPA: thymidine phosphorylase, partial [Rubrivivax sp.]
SGRAAETFARMVAALGGPRDVLEDARLTAAPVQRDVPAPRGGVLRAMDTRALGLAVIGLGGGRHRPGDAVDPRVGFSQVRALGTRLQAGEAMACVHAADTAAADAAVQAFVAAITLGEAGFSPAPVVQQLIVE